MNNNFILHNASAGAANSGAWAHPLVVAGNTFKHKSLSDFSANIAMGCTHGCKFCYVPSVSAIKQGPALSVLGVEDPDAEWGKYAFLRQWSPDEFRKSVQRAERTPVAGLSQDGHRAVFYCSTTDPYQILWHPDKQRRKQLNALRAQLVRESLTILLNESTLNVRILTRSPLVRQDFELIRAFGNRITVGFSIPSLNEKVVRFYEPNAPSPARRLEALMDASKMGIPVYVALAPTFPECDHQDMLATMRAIAPAKPITVFMEPINIRAKNVERMEKDAVADAFPFRADVFATPERWGAYAVQAFCDAEHAAQAAGLSDRLHLWIDARLGTDAFLRRQANPENYRRWALYWWNRISEWPGEFEGKTNAGAPLNPLLLAQSMEQHGGAA